MKAAQLFLPEKQQVNIVLWSWGSSSNKPTWGPLAPKPGFGFNGKKNIQRFLHLQAIQPKKEPNRPTKWLLGKSEKWEADGRTAL